MYAVKMQCIELCDLLIIQQARITTLIVLQKHYFSVLTFYEK
jgi:hypothetical protein